MNLSVNLFKDAMSNLPSGVSVITCSDSSGKLYGFTATSLTSVSLNPPLILFCINSLSKTLPAIMESKKFAISILAEEGKEVSNHFASINRDKFANYTNYSLGQFSNSPLIQPANCNIECSLYSKYDGGDHKIILGLVENILIRNEKMPLSYYKRNYHQLKKI